MHYKNCDCVMVFLGLLFSLFLGVMIIPVVHANTASSNVSLDAQLSPVLPKACYFSASFQETKRLEGLSLPIVSTGKLLFACDKGLIWNTVNPIEDAFIYLHARRHYYFNPQVPKKPITRLKGRLHSNLGKLLLAVMGADYEYLDKYFTVLAPRTHAPTQDNSIGANKKSHTVLVPKKKSMKKFIAQLIIHEKPNGIEIVFEQPKVSTTQLTISDVQVHTEWSGQHCQAFFTFGDILCQQLASSKRLEL